MTKGITRGHVRLLLSILGILLGTIALGFSIYTHELDSRRLAALDQAITILANTQSQKNTEAALLLTAQEEALKQAQTSADVAKQESLAVSDKLSSLVASVSKTNKASSNTVITSSEITKYLDGVVQVVCELNNGNISSGSGSLWKLQSLSYAVLTNKHVIDDAKKCVVSVSDKDFKTLGVYALSDSIFTYNKDTDAAIIEIKNAVSQNAALLSSFNYTLSSLNKCATSIPIGSPMVSIGFPAYAKRDTETNLETIGTVKTIYRTVTNGIISGYDTSQVKPSGTLSQPNFFISAKIDSGNSGGLALAKDQNGLCVLGLPTWLTIGNYETQGLVQNIRNILP